MYLYIHTHIHVYLYIHVAFIHVFFFTNTGPLPYNSVLYVHLHHMPEANVHFQSRTMIKKNSELPWKEF